MDEKDKEIKAEIEAGKKKLKEEIKKKEEEASRNLDKLLEYEKTDPMKVLGKEKEEKEKIFFTKEPKHVEPLIREGSVLDAKWKDKIENLTDAYIGLLREKFKRSYPDFTPTEFIEKAKANASIGKAEMNIVVEKKSFLRSESKLNVLVRPLYGKEKDDIEFAINSLKEQNLYTILVFVGDDVSKQAIAFLDSTNNPNLSVTLTQPAQQLTYTDNKQITKLYSKWLFSEKQPSGLKDILHNLSDDVDGRYVLDAEKLTDLFGFTVSEAKDFLHTCKFLEAVDETNSFFFKR